MKHVPYPGEHQPKARLYAKDKQRYADLVATLRRLGFYDNTEWDNQLPELDRRFNALFYPGAFRCSTWVNTKPFNLLRFQRGWNQPWRRRCRRKPVILLEDGWWCSKCVKARPLPLWAESPDLHWRPARLGGLGTGPSINLRSLPVKDQALLDQQQVEQQLHISTEQLWSYMKDWRLNPVQGGNREPYKWAIEDVEALAKALVDEAARRLGYEETR